MTTIFVRHFFSPPSPTSPLFAPPTFKKNLFRKSRSIQYKLSMLANFFFFFLVKCADHPPVWVILPFSKKKAIRFVESCLYGSYTNPTKLSKILNFFGKWRLHNCGNTTEASTLLQQFIKTSIFCTNYPLKGGFFFVLHPMGFPSPPYINLLLFFAVLSFLRAVFISFLFERR